MNRRLLLPLLLILLIAAGCSRPGPVLGEEKLARLLVDLELANAYATEQRVQKFDNDSMRLALRESVLAKHGVNEATLDTTLRWYGANLPKLIKVYDRADSILSDSLRALDLEEQNILAAAAGDSTEVWPLRPSIPLEDAQFFAFELPLDSSWRRGDVVEWNLALHNLRNEEVAVTLGANYSDKAQTVNSFTVNRQGRDNPRFSLLLQLDRQKKARRVFGYIRVPLDSGRRVFIDSITLVRTRMIDDDYHSRRYRVQSISRKRGL
ncbi:MAG: DUF4296 domain-containing protein [Muribaculaceae bacterium]|nr:DUF4296 domain-containing protein [Muribaculaceae bacterium]